MERKFPTVIAHTHTHNKIKAVTSTMKGIHGMGQFLIGTFDLVRRSGKVPVR
jgi:hypothetical protein